ncbi:putative quinol monooxygenase [Maridesulfovibrio bastinii]|uniref:putative quinol monooxygenase n=1 Tax=Maridesulfovibrio bastinii TaxID=47157 RepID=UPI00048A2944|nr:antibiotic biosynthesis monooxygenase [Maridesulfovibrio bastinii]
MNNNLVFTVQFDIKPEYISIFEKSLLHILNNMSAEDTFVSCYLDKNLSNETRYILYEIWNEPSVEAFIENQGSKEYRTEFNENIDNWTSSEKKVTMLAPVQEWHK